MPLPAGQVDAAPPASTWRCPAHRSECRQCGDTLTDFAKDERICRTCGWWTFADVCLCDEPQCEHVEQSPVDWPEFEARCLAPALCDPFDFHLQRDRRWCFDHCPDHECNARPRHMITTLPRPADWWPPGYDPATDTRPNKYKQRRVRGRKIREHRLVMEEHLAEQGRTLADSDDVHHRNGLKWDNRICNLILEDHRSHGVKHNPPTYPTSSDCSVCGDRFTPHKTSRRDQTTCSKRCGRAAAVRTRYGKARMLSYCARKAIPVAIEPLIVPVAELAPMADGLQLGLFDDLAPSTARPKRRRR